MCEEARAVRYVRYPGLLHCRNKARVCYPGRLSSLLHNEARVRLILVDFSWFCRMSQRVRMILWGTAHTYSIAKGRKFVTPHIPLNEIEIFRIRFLKSLFQSINAVLMRLTIPLAPSQMIRISFH